MATPAPNSPALMPDILFSALAVPGLGWLIFAAFLAGLVRGFTGFGSALVYLPIAAQFLSPVWVLVTLVLKDVLGPLPNLPRARRDSNMAQVGWMALGMVLAMPLGLMALYTIDPLVFRYTVSICALTVPLILMAGFRYRGAMSRPLLLGTGAASGFFGAAAGVPGPPVILLYLSSNAPASRIRANAMIYLLIFDISLLAMLGLQGQMALLPVALGLLLVAPAMLGSVVGGSVFRSENARLYRVAGYSITMGAALVGLPLWD